MNEELNTEMNESVDNGEVYDTNCCDTANLIIKAVGGAIAGVATAVTARKLIKKAREKKAGAEKEPKPAKEHKKLKIQSPITFVPKEKKEEEEAE